MYLAEDSDGLRMIRDLLRMTAMMLSWKGIGANACNMALEVDEQR
jgi:hypothetical protein